MARTEDILNEALEDEEDFVPRYPYDRDNMVREIKIVTPSGEFTTTARVTEDFDEAVENPEVQYYHRGGQIIGRSGKKYGFHPGPDWFIKGYKWERGRPEHEGAI